MARDDNFFSWPPSPQLAAAAFPYIRAAYNNLYHEFACPYMDKWDRKILGLPEPAPPAANRRNPNQARRARPQGDANDANRNGGFVGGLIDAVFDTFEIPDVELDVDVEVVEGEIEDENAIARLQVLVEELEEEEEDDEVPAAEGEAGQQQVQGNNQQPAVQQPAQAAPAPAPRQRGLQASLRDMTNALASTLLLPMISAGMGELIRLALPKHLTTAPGGFGRFRYKTGLLQDQWGRNLVGGCIYIVLRDAFKLYTKYRMAENKPLRRIRNIDRRRGNASS